MNALPTRDRLCGLLLALGAALVLPACSGPVDENGRAEFHAALGHTSITVFPAWVRSNTEEGTRADPASATRLAAWLGERGLASASVSDAAVALPEDVQGFQHDLFQRGGEAFSAYVRAHPPATAYALLPEYLITRVPDGGARAGGVHAYIVDERGRLVDALLLNSHHALFRKAAAATPAECTELVIAAFTEDWAAAR
jgi:hypothetical protein